MAGEGGSSHGGVLQTTAASSLQSTPTQSDRVTTFGPKQLPLESVTNTDSMTQLLNLLQINGAWRR